MRTLDDRKRLALLAVALLLTLAGLWPLARGTAWAQSGGPYDLNWNTIDGGGTMVASGGDFTLKGTIGQPDAGVLAGGTFTLHGGFWAGGSLVHFRVYLPIVLRKDS